MECKMTWEELKKRAKEMGYSNVYDGFYRGVKKGEMIFYECGVVGVQVEDDFEFDITDERTPEQMLQIMEALQ